MPVYFVILATEPYPNMSFFVQRIVKVYACDIKEIDQYYPEVNRLAVESNHGISTMILLREPENPFKEAVANA